jgi:hypothetical protein
VYLYVNNEKEVYLCMNNMDSYVLEEEMTFQVYIYMRIMERNVYLCMNNEKEGVLVYE